MRGWFSSLRVRLIVLVLIATLPAFALILWTSLEERQSERDHARDTAENITQSISAQEDQVIQNARELLGKLSIAPQVAGGDLAACHAYLAQVKTVEARYAGFAATNLQGQIYCWDQDLQPQVNVADRAYFQHLVSTSQFSLGGYVIARNSTKAASLSMAYPMFDAQGKLVGMVSTGVTLDWLNDFSSRIALPQDTTLTVIDPNGVVLARRPDPEIWVGKSVTDKPLGQTVLTSGQGSAELTGLDGKQRLFAFQPLSGGLGNNAYVAVGISTATAYAGINHTLERNLALLGAVTLLALAAAWFGGDWFVVRRIRLLISATERVARGDLAARTSVRRDRGEIGQLARAFDEMSQTLEQRDLDRKRAEEELAQRAVELVRSNSELEQFAYVASHDLQEPLRMVGNYTQLLARRYKGKLDADADEFINYAVDGARRMQELINDLLGFSRVGTRGKEFVPTPTEAVLERTLLNLGPAVEESGALVTHDPLPTVMADDGQLGQVFQNLIGNALKFRDGTEPRINVSAEAKDGEWVFSVKDNGIGISPEYHERIFVIFQRLHGREQYRGTGMGLAICKKIVERHGGRIWVESDAGAGSTFYFSMPASANVLAEAA